jgi:RNA polymerase sigma-70 factor (ECF subfamily)
MGEFDERDGPVPGEPGGGLPRDACAGDIAAARRGCELALNRLFTSCRAYLLLVANQVLPRGLRHKEGVSDVVQDTLLQGRKNFDRFHGTSERELRFWLRGVLLNNVQDTTRRFFQTEMRDVGREVSLNQGLSDAEGEHLVDRLVRSPGRQAMAAEEAACLSAALARLPEDYRQIIQLRNWEERSFVEIATVLGGTADAARKLWARAIQRLRGELPDDLSISGEASHG